MDQKKYVFGQFSRNATYTLISLENSLRTFSCKYCVENPDTIFGKDEAN